MQTKYDPNAEFLKVFGILLRKKAKKIVLRGYLKKLPAIYTNSTHIEIPCTCEQMQFIIAKMERIRRKRKTQLEKEIWDCDFQMRVHRMQVDAVRA